MTPEQAASVTGDGYLAGSLMHEIATIWDRHTRGSNGKQVDINEAIGPAYAGLEEAKADIVGHVRHEVAGRSRRTAARSGWRSTTHRTSAGIFRTLRFGTAEAHGRAEMMEFNYPRRAAARSRGRRALPDRLRAVAPPSRRSPRSCSSRKRPATGPATRHGSRNTARCPPSSRPRLAVRPRRAHRRRPGVQRRKTFRKGVTHCSP